MDAYNVINTITNIKWKLKHWRGNRMDNSDLNFIDILCNACGKYYRVARFKPFNSNTCPKCVTGILNNLRER
tara:strand:+ start:89 stop:304 length:216 start_codon:yes stop_codon:yes gene_type:complete